MVNGKNENDGAVKSQKNHLLFTIYHLPKKERSAGLTLLSSFKLLGPLEVAISFGRRLHIYINFLCATAAKQPPSKCKEHYQNDDHEDHQNCDNARAAATITIISHEATPPVLGGTKCGGCERIVTTSPRQRQSDCNQKKRETRNSCLPFEVIERRSIWLPSASSDAATPGGRGGRSNITWLDRRRRLRRCGALRHDP